MSTLLPMLPLSDLDISSLFETFALAQTRLSRYDGILEGVNYGNVLLSPLQTQEAVLSSRIEGTQSTIDDVYSQEAGDITDETQGRDVQEILNYRTALRYGSRSLNERGITLGLMKELHAILLDSVRGQGKTPGTFRATQNWIGSRGCGIEEASYVPPAPETLSSYLDNWIEQIDAVGVPPLLLAGILHAQFELIHPFNDGNGRVGRLFIPLFLCKRGQLQRPHFYLSEYFEQHRNDYVDNLSRLNREKGAWNRWLHFFLRAVAEQAQENIRRAAALKRLHDVLMEQFSSATRSSSAYKLLDAIFENPTFTRPLIQRRVSDLTASSLQRMLDALVAAEVLKIKRPSAGRKPAVYRLEELTLIAEGKAIRFFSY